MGCYLASQFGPEGHRIVTNYLANQFLPERCRPTTHYIASQFGPDGHIAKDAAFNQEVLTVQDKYFLASQFWPEGHRPITNYFASQFWPEGYLSAMHQVLCSIEGYQHFHIIQCIGWFVRLEYLRRQALASNTKLQWNLSVTTTSKIKCITCDLFSNVF